MLDDEDGEPERRTRESCNAFLHYTTTTLHVGHLDGLKVKQTWEVGCLS
jgi:hypothetical protein